MTAIAPGHRTPFDGVASPGERDELATGPPSQNEPAEAGFFWCLVVTELWFVCCDIFGAWQNLAAVVSAHRAGLWLV